MDDFEAFKKKKQAEQKAENQAAKDEKAFDEAAKKMGWVDGFGFAGATNPKVKGFVLGRAKKKKVDPNALEKPKNMETHRHDAPAAGKPAAPPPKPGPKPKNFNKF